MNKKANAASISRILGTTFKRSTSGTTRIRGWHNISEGFEVQSRNFGAVIVWNGASGYTKESFESRDERRNSNLNGILETLIKNGYSATRNANCIVVTNEVAA